MDFVNDFFVSEKTSNNYIIGSIRKQYVSVINKQDATRQSILKTREKANLYIEKCEN